ncbi:MAG: DUF4097 family beta strand repeat-containing protein [Acidobacteriota bacterium]|jgi:hypothetical protein
MKSFRIMALIAVVVLLPAWLCGADQIEKSFQVSTGGLLNVQADRASITVTTQPQAAATVTIIPRGWSVGEMEKDFAIDLHQSGNEIIVEVRARHRLSNWFGWNSNRIRIEAVIPDNFNVDLKTSGGGISVADLTGEVRSETSGGGISLGKIDGPVYAKTSGGSVELSASKGNAELYTSGGSIRMGDVEGRIVASTSGGSVTVEHAEGQIQAETSGGGIHVKEIFGSIDARTSGGSVSAELRSQPDGDCRLQTSGGNITVRLAPDLQFDVDAKTSGGRVKTDVPITVQGTLGKSHVEGRLNGGGPSLYLRTSGGSISIESI